MKLLRFTALCALICWQIQVINTYIEPFTTGNVFAWRGENDVVFIADFVRYYVAGEMARSAEHLHVYEIAAHFPFVNQLISPLVVTKQSSLSFPPSVFLIMSLVSHLQLLTAYIVWVIGSAICGIFGLSFLLRAVRKFGTVDTVMFCLAVADSLPAVVAIRTGQWVWWLVGISSLFFYTSTKRREIVSGILLGILAVKPQFALPLIVVTLGQRRWRTSASAALTILALNIGAGLLIGFKNVIEYPKMLAHLEVLQDVGVFPQTHASLRGLLSNVLPEQSAFVASTSLYWLPLLILFIICLRTKSDSLQSQRWTWALAVLVGMVFAPSMFPYDLTLICLPAALTMKTISPFQIAKLRSRPLLAWHAVLFVYPALGWLIGLLPSRINFCYALINMFLITCGMLYLKSQDFNSAEKQN